MAQAKRWFITGCSSGFGRALAELALDRGESVAVTARRPEAIADIVARAPGRAVGLALDVTDGDQVRAARDAAWQALGGVDVLVNNAGYGIQGSLEDVSDEQARAMFEVNLFGLIDTIRAFLPMMREQGGGHIINVTSVGGRTSAPLISLYSASKYAVEGLSAGLAGELAGQNIRVSCVEPGAFRTDFATRGLVDIEPSAPYAELTAQTREITGSFNYEDPRGAARVIAMVAQRDDPPAQLPVGAMAQNVLEGVAKAQLAELERWRELACEASRPLPTD